MKRVAVAGLFALMVAILLLVPTPANAGNYGCNYAGYTQPYYPNNYYQSGHYVYPAGYYQQTYSSSPYVQAAPYSAPYVPPPGTCIDTSGGTVCNQGYGNSSHPTGYDQNPYYPQFRVAQDVINARLAQEAAIAAVNTLKSEMAKEAATQKALALEQRNIEFQNSVLQMLAQRPQPVQVVTQPSAPQVVGPPAVDYDRARLEAENAAMKAALLRIANTPPPPAAPPVAAPGAIPPAVPRAANDPVIGNLQLAINNGCMPCHGNGKSPRLDMSDCSKLTGKQIADSMRRMGLPQADKDHMPKDREPVSGEVYFAFSQRLVQLSGGN